MTISFKINIIYIKSTMSKKSTEKDATHNANAKAPAKASADASAEGSDKSDDLPKTIDKKKDTVVKEDEKKKETNNSVMATSKFPTDVGVPRISQTLPVPKYLVGYLVGREGKTLKGIMKGSSTRIYIQENERDPEWSYAHVQGSARAVNRGKKILINAMLRAGSDNSKKAKPSAKKS